MKQQLCLILIISFLVGIIAPACNFLWGGQYSIIEICTAQGIEKIAIANDQQPEDGQTPISGKNCDFCFQNAHFSGHIIDTSLTEKLVFQASHRFQLYEDLLLSHLSADHSARGPPSFV